MSSHPYDAWYAVSRREIPTHLSAGAIIEKRRGTAVWIENFRGYSTGFTVMTNVLTSVDLMSKLGLDIGPDLTGVDPDPSRFEFWITTASGTYRNLDESLTLVSATGGRRLASATWWIPETPSQNITIGYAWKSAALHHECTVDATEWSQRMSEVRRLDRGRVVAAPRRGRNRDS